jgi:hypothetical protein
MWTGPFTTQDLWLSLTVLLVIGVAGAWGIVYSPPRLLVPVYVLSVLALTGGPFFALLAVRVA